MAGMFAPRMYDGRKVSGDPVYLIHPDSRDRLHGVV